MDVHWTNKLTRQTESPRIPIRIWEGCDPKIARAIWDFQRACAATPANARWRAMPSLIRRHLDTALLATLAANGVPIETLSSLLSSKGLSAARSRDLALDRDLCVFNRLTQNALAGSVDTLREAIRWVTDHRPARVAGPLKGDRRRSANTKQSPSWPYCEHCGRLSERAQQFHEGNLQNTSCEEGRRYSRRFCLNHKQEQGGSQRSARRKAAEFEQVLRALKRELSIDRAFRARFIQRAWELEGTPPLELSDNLQISAWKATSPLILDPVKTYIRECAYRIARELPDETAIAIARKSAEGLTQAKIASDLKLKPQTISQRVRKSRGYYDFSRSTKLLYWWPDDTLAGHDVLRFE